MPRLLVFALFSLLLPGAHDVEAAPVTLSDAMLVVENAALGEQAGVSVAISEAGSPLVFAVVGASGANFGHGAAYVFWWTGADWLFDAELVAPDADVGDAFGAAVAIDGNTIVIGAPLWDAPRSGLFSRNQAGAAYVFELDGSGQWQFSQRLLQQTSEENDVFGSAVAIDNDRIVVGAPKEDIGVLLDHGAVSVFEKRGSEWQRTVTFSHDPGIGGDLFGTAVDVDGDRIVVGAPGRDIDALVPLEILRLLLKLPPSATPDLKNAGNAYIFELVDGTWRQRQRLTHSLQMPHDRFGTSVALDANRIVVGAPFEDAVPDLLGLLIDKNHKEFLEVLNQVGLESATELWNDTGAAYIFEPRADGRWREVQELTVFPMWPGDTFGSSVAIAGDRIVVGAPLRDDVDKPTLTGFDSGAAFVWRRDAATNTWIRSGLLTGESVNGTWEPLVINRFSTAGQDIYRLLLELLNLGRPLGDHFARSVAIGEQILVGAPLDEDLGQPRELNSGAAHAYLLAPPTGIDTAERRIDNFGTDQGWVADKHVRLMADVDGDGMADVVGFGDDGIGVALATGDGGFDHTPVPWLGNFGFNQGWRVDKHLRMMADVNGDGRADVVAFGDEGVGVAISTGSGFDHVPRPWVEFFGYNQGWRVMDHPRMMADINGDGKDDIVGFGQDGIYVSVSDGSAFSEPARWLANFGYDQGWRPDKNPRMLADVNGDGMADVVGFGDDGVGVALATGQGFDHTSPQPWIAAYGFNQQWWTTNPDGTVEHFPRTMTDVNGDGLADVVGFGKDGVYVSTSDGSRFSLPRRWLGNFGYDHAWRVARHLRLMADVNGDGMADVVGFGDAGVGLAFSTGSSFDHVPDPWVEFFGFNQRWLVGEHPREMSDVNGDGKDDIVGFGRDGVWVVLSEGFAAPPVLRPDNLSVRVDEGQAAANSGTVNSVAETPLTFTASAGTVLDIGDGTWSWHFDSSDGPLESQPVTITASDGTDTGITVFDLTVNNIAPITDAGSEQTVYRQEALTVVGTWTDPAGTLDAPYAWSWKLDGDGVTDRSGEALDLIPVEHSLSFADAGVYTLHFTVTDKDGGVGTDAVKVTVLNQPPQCGDAVASVDQLWPPNKRFHAVEVRGVSDPENDPIAITIDGIFQDEPVATKNKGKFVPDGRGVGTSVAEVRAERDGHGDGRVYHIQFTADDGQGGRCAGVVFVGVPHDKKSTPIDGGALYDSVFAPTA